MTELSDSRSNVALACYELCLDGEWHAGVGVSPDGSTWPWLIGPPGTSDATTPVWPAHELLGPLSPTSTRSGAESHGVMDGDEPHRAVTAGDPYLW
jgi:hypothetical protein